MPREIAAEAVDYYHRAGVPAPHLNWEDPYLAQRDTTDAYGYAVFSVDPGNGPGQTTVTMSYYHAPGADQVPTPNYQLLEQIVLAKHRRR